MVDVSDATFSLIESNDITVTYPNGGESFNVDDIVTITWDNLPTASGQYTVQYSSGGGWSNIATNVTGNAVNWTVPNANSENCSIRVLDYNNTCKSDSSDDVFTILPKEALMYAPNGGDVLYSGNNRNITWDASTFYTHVRIEYSTDGGLTWNIIDSYESNDGSYYWTVPNESSTDCLIKVSHHNDAYHYDISDALFTIKPAVTVLTPNGDNGTSTFLGGCTITSISIDRAPNWNLYTIQYSLDNGISWNTITTNWNTTSNPATYDWDIPNIASTDCLIKVYPNLASSYDDVSDNTFTIEQPITIIQPNFGGNLQVGATYDISWSTDGVSNLYDLYYSTTNGASWVEIETGYNTSNNTYPWTVPNNISSNCLIQVVDNIDNCKSDISDYTFSITNSAVPLTLLTPNGGEMLQPCMEYEITWDEPSPLAGYDLAYSTDLGATWTTIVSNHVTTNASYTWAVPIINSPSVLLRVKEYEGTAFDLSDALFNINYVPLSVSPTEVTIDKGNSVQLMASGGFGNYSWSPAIGLDNPAIANPIAMPLTSTTYIVSTFNGSCIISDTVVVTVNNNVYVDHTATGNNSGTDWGNAFTDLQDALALGTGVIIHIAKGTYYPTTGTIRGTAFNFSSDVTLLGGYPNGGGTRNVSSNETILSGNVDGIAGYDGNSYHVIKLQGADNVVIDGISIRDGAATDASSFGRARGGGAYIIESTVRFINTTFKWNRAIYGGGLFATLSPDVTFEKCTFKKNQSDYGSALYHSNMTNMYVLSSRIIDNMSLVRCAIEVNNSLYTYLENSLVANNASTNSNAIALIATNRDQSLDMYNCTILGETKNKYLISMQIGFGDQLDVNIYNSIIAHQNLSFDKNFVAYNNNILNLITENCYIQGASSISTGNNNIFSDVAGDLMLNADYSLDACSPAVNAGDNNYAVQLLEDIDANFRFYSTVDMGAFEAQSNCVSSKEQDGNISENIKEESIYIFPNPTTHILYINSNLDDLEIRLFDMMGRQALTTRSKEIDMSELPSGIYLMRIYSQGQFIRNEKVMKE